MDRFVVTGGARLAGEVSVTGAKNSVLKLMAASLLAPGVTTLRAVPDILDVTIMSEVLRRLGCTVTRTERCVVIDVPQGTMTVLLDETAQPGALIAVPPLSVTPVWAASSARMQPGIEIAGISAAALAQL